MADEKKKRGRQKGQVVEREPAIYVELNKQFRVKIDKLNMTLQEKGKAENEDDNEDAGWKNLGYQYRDWETDRKSTRLNSSH